MKHKVPHSHEFATLAPPPLYIEHANQSNNNNINNNNINYDDEMCKESDNLHHLELNRSFVIAEIQQNFTVAATYQIC